MAWLGGLVLIATGLALLVWFLRRERAALWRQRRGVLADCLALVDEGEISVAADGFSRLVGTIGGRQVRADLLPDSLTLRRLPQLWLSLTIVMPLPAGAAFGVLVRPSGNEFYARTPDLPLRFESPTDFPTEVSVRGSGRQVAAFLSLAREPLAELLADPKVKEILATPRGLRVIYQAAEGQRGQHLLLRQCDFGEARVEASTFLRLHDGLDAVASALLPAAKIEAPAKRGLQA
jgi:hypothetical protein